MQNLKSTLVPCRILYSEFVKAQLAVRRYSWANEVRRSARSFFSALRKVLK